MYQNNQHKRTWGDLRRYADALFPYKNQCPECGEPFKEPSYQVCTLNQMMNRVIPAGSHIHIQCPVHGSHRIDGPDYRWG